MTPWASWGELLPWCQQGSQRRSSALSALKFKQVRTHTDHPAVRSTVPASPHCAGGMDPSWIWAQTAGTSFSNVVLDSNRKHLFSPFKLPVSLTKQASAIHTLLLDPIPTLVWSCLPLQQLHLLSLPLPTLTHHDPPGFLFPQSG